MKLNQLFEKTGTEKLAFCFGRLNPPTVGHAHLFDVLADAGTNYRIFVSGTQDQKKNPLSFEEKVNFIQKMNPVHAEHVSLNKGLNTVVKVAVNLYDAGFRNVVFVAGDDRRDIFDMLTTYNGVEGKAHGYYKFDTLEFQSSGARDPDSDGIESVSASTARQKALEGDFEGFESATGAGEYTKELYNAVRAGLGIKNESS